MFYYGRITLYLFYFFLGYKYLDTKSGYIACVWLSGTIFCIITNIFTFLSYLIECLYVVHSTVIFCQFSKSRSIKKALTFFCSAPTHNSVFVYSSHKKNRFSKLVSVSIWWIPNPKPVLETVVESMSPAGPAEGQTI